jgi:hypothetical protein
MKDRHINAMGISVITPNIPQPQTVPGSTIFPKQIPHPLNNLLPDDRHRPDFMNLNEWENWLNWTVLTEDIERLTNFDLLPALNPVIKTPLQP